MADEVYMGDLDEGLAVLEAGDASNELFGRSMADRSERQ